MSGVERVDGCVVSKAIPLPPCGVDTVAPRWFAAYVNPRHEKSVAKQLDGRYIESFLPLYEAEHRWKNGRHKVQLPLFPGYVFVRIHAAERVKVLEVPGVGYIVGCRGVLTPLPTGEIEGLRNMLQSGVLAQPFPYIKTGSRVEICNGPLRGVVGTLRRWRGALRAIISVDLIEQSIAVEVDACDVTQMKARQLTNAKSIS